MVSTDEIVQNYLSTLGLSEEIKTLSDINLLIQAHQKMFAFSSLKVLLKENISLELKDIYYSIVVQKRGGYCFEHNKLLYEVLKALNFDVEFYLARVVNNTHSETPKVPLTHRFTLLKFEGERYLIDVGVGIFSPNVAIKFADEITPSHLGKSYTIESLNNQSYAMNIIEKGKAFRATTFDLAPCSEADCEMGHFYSHKHPNAIFVNNLVASRISQEQILSLRNRAYFKIDAKNTKRVLIENKEQLATIIKDDFDLSFSEEETTLLYHNFIKKSVSNL